MLVIEVVFEKLTRVHILKRVYAEHAKLWLVSYFFCFNKNSASTHIKTPNQATTEQLQALAIETSFAIDLLPNINQGIKRFSIAFYHL